LTDVGERFKEFCRRIGGRFEVVADRDIYKEFTCYLDAPKKLTISAGEYRGEAYMNIISHQEDVDLELVGEKVEVSVLDADVVNIGNRGGTAIKSVKRINLKYHMGPAPNRDLIMVGIN